MYLKPLTRIIDRPIGYVVDSQTIIGEWEGTRWEDIPYKAALYVNERAAVEDRYQAGEITSTRWVKSEGRSYGRITGWRYVDPRNHPHNLYFLRNFLSPIRSSQRRFRAVADFVQFFRDAGCNVGSPIGMLGSLFKSTLTESLYLSDESIPTGELYRGSRIQHRGGIAAEFPAATLWDMRSAFPAALGQVAIPKRWQHYTLMAPTQLPEAPSGFARAVVRIPPGVAGPLPDAGMIPARYPTNEYLTGVWSFEELRAAQANGTEVRPLELWTAHSFTNPYQGWIDALAYARTVLPPDSVRLLKMAANGYVGTLAMEGRRGHSEVRNGREVYWTEKGYRRPDSIGTHALVTSNVRARLYAEALAPWWLLFVSCHTDGAILLDTPHTLIGTGLGAVPGDWVEKRRMRKVLLLDAQRYAWENENGELRYCVAGVPQPYVETSFMARWSGTLKRIHVRRK